MKVVVNKEPFTHYDVKDFLTTEDFSVVYNYMEKLENPLKPFSNFVDCFYIKSSKNIGKKRKTNSTLKTLQQETFTPTSDEKNVCAILQKTFIRFLKEINMPHSSIFGFEFARQSKKYKYEIHTDKIEKKYSFVLYVSKTGSGTKLYDKNKNLVKVCDWGMNGGIGFVRSDYSFHSYDSQEKEIRKSIVMNVY